VRLDGVNGGGDTECGENPPNNDRVACVAGFDFVWHLPAVVLTVTLLAGVVLPAPHGAGARTPFRTAPGKESDENQVAS
jgi:hypothetical protein